METISLGNQGLVVSRQGLGCMGMSDFYGALDDDESIATIQRALSAGVTFFDTADMYRPFTNEVACDASLARLGIDHIDLYYRHRVTTNTGSIPTRR